MENVQLVTELVPISPDSERARNVAGRGIAQCARDLVSNPKRLAHRSRDLLYPVTGGLT